MPPSRSVVHRYYLYRATLSVGFITPIFTLFLLRTLSFTQVGVLSAVYAALSVLGEIPTGYVGDRFGRRASLLLSVGFSVASLVGFVVAQSFAWYLLLYALWALALTFRSGSADAWLYDLLAERLDERSFTGVRGRGDAVQQWTAAVTMIGGGALYGVDPTYPFVAAAVVAALGFVALLTLPKNRAYRTGTTDEDDIDRDDTHGSDDRVGPVEALRAVGGELTRPPLRSSVAYFGLFTAVVGVAMAYVQPMAVETLAPFATRFGVDLPATGAMRAAASGETGATIAIGLGVMYAGLSAISSIGGYYAGAAEERLGTRRALLFATVTTAGLLVLPVRIALLALPAFAAMRTGPALVRPVAIGYVNDRVGTVGRATLLSAVSMLTMTVRAPLALATGMLADATSATAAVAALGGGFLVAAGALWVGGDPFGET